MRTSFHGKLLLLTILPLTIAQVVTLFAVMRTVERDVDRRARESLTVGAAVAEEYLSSRADQVQTSVSVMAADFGLKEAVATTDADSIRSALENHGRRVGADVVLIVGLDGRRITSTAPLPETRFERRLAAEPDDETGAFDYGEAIDGRAWHLFAVPLKAPTTIAWVVVGFDFGNAVSDRVAALTGLSAMLLDAGSRAVYARSGPAAASLVPTDFSPHDGRVYRIGDAASGYLALDTPLVAGNTALRLVLLRSLSDAMAPYTEARRWLLAFALLLLVLGAAAAVWISSGIARPVRQLTRAVRDVISGQYDAAVAVRTDDEIGELAVNFNRMRTAIAEREQRIRHQAQHDPLTDLPNRNRIVEQLDGLIGVGASAPVSVLSVRLTRMNEISSTLGHDASDQLIRTAAKHLELNQADGDVLGQLGTHEFVVLLPGRDADAARAHAERVEALLSAGVTLDRINIALRTEIGIATFPAHGRSATDLLRNAMIARTESATRGDTIATYESGREKHYEKQLRIVNDLRSAIRRNELLVVYQAKMALASGGISGAEALVRWQHREFGWLSPDDFVPAAEEAGTIMHLTRHVIRQAIRDCRGWQDQAGRPLQVSVNISARDLQDEYLPYFVIDELRSQGLAPERLTLEVTENSVMQKVQQSLNVLQCLRDIGVRISMDDFGTGHSSLAQIRNIPLHELKIDKSFVMDMGGDRHNAAIVRTTLALAQQLGLSVVAEGVEDEETLRHLGGAGCDYAQGYFISKPVPQDEFLALATTHVARPVRERRQANRAFGHGAG